VARSLFAQFFGYGSSLTEADAFRFQNLTRTSNGFFLKLSYPSRSTASIA